MHRFKWHGQLPLLYSALRKYKAGKLGKDLRNYYPTTEKCLISGNGDFALSNEKGN